MDFNGPAGDSRLDEVDRVRAEHPHVLAAARVLEEVRRVYYHNDGDNLKSSTKIRRAYSKESEQRRREDARHAIFARRNEFFDNKAHLYAHYKKARAQNCGELSILAIELLEKEGFRAVRISIGSKKEHACAAILPADHSGRLEPDMTQWSEEIILCDPWANIACSAPHYYQKFKEKMGKWDADRKRLEFDGKEIKATDPRWIATIVGGPKTVTFDASTAPD